jgi:hypothetical protein
MGNNAKIPTNHETGKQSKTSTLYLLYVWTRMMLTM